MDIFFLILILVSVVIGILIGLLVSYLRKTPAEKPSQSPLAPKEGFNQRGIIWEDEEKNIIFEIDDKLLSAKDFFQMEPPIVQENVSPPPAPAPEESPPVSTPADSAQPESSMPEEEKINGVLSIVEQVDEILQEKLLNTHLSEKAIRLVEDPEKGMIVWVGLTSYDNVSDIPDPDISKIIKASVREWEIRSES